MEGEGKVGRAWGEGYGGAGVGGRERVGMGKGRGVAERTWGGGCGGEGGRERRGMSKGIRGGDGERSESRFTRNVFSPPCRYPFPAPS